MDDQNIQSPVPGTDQPAEPVITSPVEPVQPVSPVGDPVIAALGRIEEKLTAIATKVGA